MSLTEEAMAPAADQGISITMMTEHDLLEVVEIEESTGLSRWGWTASSDYSSAAEGPRRICDRRLQTAGTNDATCRCAGVVRTLPV